MRVWQVEIQLPCAVERAISYHRACRVERAAGCEGACGIQEDTEVLGIAVLDRIAPQDHVAIDDGTADRHQQHGRDALERRAQQLPERASHLFGLNNRTAMTTARPIRNHLVLPVRT